MRCIPPNPKRVGYIIPIHEPLDEPLYIGSIYTNRYDFLPRHLHNYDQVTVLPNHKNPRRRPLLWPGIGPGRFTQIRTKKRKLIKVLGVGNMMKIHNTKCNTQK